MGNQIEAHNTAKSLSIAYSNSIAKLRTAKRSNTGTQTREQNPNFETNTRPTTDLEELAELVSGEDLLVHAQYRIAHVLVCHPASRVSEWLRRFASVIQLSGRV